MLGQIWGTSGYCRRVHTCTSSPLSTPSRLRSVKTPLLKTRGSAEPMPSACAVCGVRCAIVRDAVSAVCDICAMQDVQC